MNKLLVLALYNLAGLLVRMKKFDEALKYNAECFNLAKASGVKYDIILCEVLNDKIRIHNYLEELAIEKNSKKEKTIESLYAHYNNLKRMMNLLDDAEFRADVASDIYYISNLLRKLGLKTKSIELYKNIALKNYNMLYNKTSRADILYKIKNLSA